MKQLNNKEIKEICKKLEEQFGLNELNLDYLFFLNNDNKIFLINRDYLRLNFDLLRVNSFGLYFGKIENTGIRLSVSCTQLIGKKAIKNVLETDNKDEWLNGKDLECDKKLFNWHIIKSNDDFLGCGYCKNGAVMNFIPKKK